MNWKSTNRDALPGHNEEVLLSVEGVNYLTIYDANAGVFRLKEDRNTHFLPCEGTYWLEIDGPSVTSARDEY
jgi:hypothetical protein